MLYIFCPTMGTAPPDHTSSPRFQVACPHWARLADRMKLPRPPASVDPDNPSSTHLGPQIFISCARRLVKLHCIPWPMASARVDQPSQRRRGREPVGLQLTEVVHVPSLQDLTQVHVPLCHKLPWSKVVTTVNPMMAASTAPATLAVTLPSVQLLGSAAPSSSKRYMPMKL